MKKTLSLLFFLLFAIASQATVNDTYGWAKRIDDNKSMQSLPEEVSQMKMTDFLKLTPKKYREMTGKRLGFFKSIKLKMAQKALKKSLKNKHKKRSNMPQWAYIVLAIIGLGWLAMGLLDDWSGSNWIISLLLYFLFYFPGLIFTLIKMGDYY